jgi:hypothetical protein
MFNELIADFNEQELRERQSQALIEAGVPH